MAISQNFPTTRPSLNLNFARSRKLDSRVTFTRGSTGTYVDESGLIRTAGINEARFDYDPISGESLGLLIEESRTNLLPESEDLTSGLISKIAITTSNDTGVIAPDGTAGATRVIQDNTTAQHLIGDTAGSLTLGGYYTLSTFVKAGTTDLVWFSVNSYTNWVSDWNFFINLTTGNVYHNSNNISSANLKVEQYPNGWWKLSMVAQQEPAGGGAGGLWIGHADPDLSANTNFTGDGSTYFYAWGFQMEAGSFPTSYIPTSGSTVTRSADVASITGTNFTDWFNPNEGTIFGKSSILSDRSYGGTFRSITQFIKTSTYNSDSIFSYVNSANQSASEVRTANVAVASIFQSEQYSANDRFAFAYALNDYAISSKGLTPATDTSGALPTGIDKLCIGNVGDNNTLGCINGTIAQISYYPVRLTNTQLQTLTK